MLVKHILAHSKYAVMIAALLALAPQRALAAGGAVESDPGFGLLAGALVFAVLGALLLGLGILAGRHMPERPRSKESEIAPNA